MMERDVKDGELPWDTFRGFCTQHLMTKIPRFRGQDRGCRRGPTMATAHLKLQFWKVSWMFAG